jgi:hypothetical protein
MDKKITVRLSDKLRKDLKKHCVDQDTTIQDAVTKMISTCLYGEEEIECDMVEPDLDDLNRSLDS